MAAVGCKTTVRPEVIVRCTTASLDRLQCSQTCSDYDCDIIKGARGDAVTQGGCTDAKGVQWRKGRAVTQGGGGGSDARGMQ